MCVCLSSKAFRNSVFFVTPSTPPVFFWNLDVVVVRSFSNVGMYPSRHHAMLSDLVPHLNVVSAVHTSHLKYSAVHNKPFHTDLTLKHQETVNAVNQQTIMANVNMIDFCPDYRG